MVAVESSGTTLLSVHVGVVSRSAGGVVVVSTSSHLGRVADDSGSA